MSTVENRVVSMTFDNNAFERRISETLKSLDQLSKSLQFAGAAQGLTNLEAAAQGFDISNMASAVENISEKFSVLGAVGFSIIQELTGKATDFASSVSGKILDPLLAGGTKRATNIENAKFQFRGLGIVVEEAMASALSAVKGTAFGLDEAAKAAAQFGASGIEVGEEMTTALRGIAGAAAMTNTSFAEIADIYTSAAGSGIVTNQDLQRFATRGLNAAAALGKELGITEQAVKDMASNGELSFKKFAEAMDGAFGEHATKANETYTGALSNMNAAIARIGASFFGPRMEQQRDLFNALTPVIDQANDALQPFIETMLRITGSGTKGLIKTLEGIDLSALEKGITFVSEGIENIHGIAIDLWGILTEAFTDIFPVKEAGKLVGFAEKFRDFTESLKLGSETAKKVKNIFKGVFAVFGIGIEIVKQLGTLLFGIFASFGKGQGGGILTFFSDMGATLADLHEHLVTGGGIAVIFEKLGEAIKKPKEFVRDFTKNMKEMFSALTGNEKANQFIDNLGTRFKSLQKVVRAVGKAFTFISDGLKTLVDFLDPIITYIVDWFKELGQKIADVMTPADFDNAVDIVNVGLLGGLVTIFKRFMDNGLTFDFTGGVLSNISGVFEQLTGTLAAMQTELKTKALLNIAVALGALTASLVVLSTIDPVALSAALAATAVGFAQLVGTLTALDQFTTGLGAAKLSLLATGMLALAAAMAVLSVAIKIMSTMSWQELARGLTGVGGGLIIMVGAMKYIPTDMSGMIRAGIAMTGMAIAMLALSAAVKAFSTMEWEELGKGLVSVGVGMGIFTLAMKYMPSGMLGTSIGLVAISVSLIILAEAVERFAALDWEVLGKGFLGIGGGLAVIALAMSLMPLSLPLTASGLVIVSGALIILAKAVAEMAKIPWKSMAKSIGGFAVLLGVLALAMHGMNGALVGAAALVVVSGALHILTKVLESLAKLSIAEIATGLITIAALMGVIGAAAALIAPVLPALYGLAGAIFLLGGAFALFGAGVALVAKGFEIIAKVGRTSAQVFVDIIKIFKTAMPEIAAAFLDSIATLAEKVMELIPTLVKAFTVMVSHILDSVEELAPKLIEVATVAVMALIKSFEAIAPKLIETGFVILMSFLEGVRNNIYEIAILSGEIINKFIEGILENIDLLIDTGVNLLISFLDGMSDRASDIVEAGSDLLSSFLRGISDNVHEVVNAVGDIITEFINAVSDNINDIITAGANLIIDFVKGIANNLQRVIDAGFDTVIKFINGLADSIRENKPKLRAAGLNLLDALFGGVIEKAKDVSKWFGNFPIKVLEWIGNLTRTLLGKGADLIGGLFGGIVNIIKHVASFFMNLGGAIVTWVGSLLKTLYEAGKDVIRGLWDGISSMTGWIENKVGGLGSNLLSSFSNALGIFSPSREFATLGKYIMLGLGVGIDRNSETPMNSLKRVSKKLSTMMEDMDDFNPKITPVLDLSRVQSESQNIGRLFDASSIRPDVSIDQAKIISSSTQSRTEEDSSVQSPSISEIKFEQNNYSPKELSTNDIYRNTKSQIALAREELSV